MIGSANLSTSSRKLVEAVVVSTDGRIRRQLQTWIGGLERRARVIDSRFIARVLKIPVTQRRAIAAGPRTKLSLLDALASNDPLIDDFAFAFYWDESTTNDREVRKAAKRKAIVLPSTGVVWYEDDYSQRFERKTREVLKEHYLLAFDCAVDEHGHCKRVKTLDTRQESFLGTVKVGGSLLTLVDASKPSPFKLTGPEAKQLCAILTRGLQRAPRLWKHIAEAPAGLVGSEIVKALFRHGRSIR